MSVIEKLATKFGVAGALVLKDYSANKLKSGTPAKSSEVVEQVLAPAIAAALSEFREECVRAVEQGCDGYVKYAQDAPENSSVWAKVTAETAKRIKSDITEAIKKL